MFIGSVNKLKQLADVDLDTFKNNSNFNNLKSENFNNLIDK